MLYDPTNGDTVTVPNQGKGLVLRRISKTHVFVRLENGSQVAAAIADLVRVVAEQATLTINGITITEP